MFTVCVEVLVNDATGHFPSPAQHVSAIAESQIPDMIRFVRQLRANYVERTGVFSSVKL